MIFNSSNKLNGCQWASAHLSTLLTVGLLSLASHVRSAPQGFLGGGRDISCTRGQKVDFTHFFPGANPGMFKCFACSCPNDIIECAAISNCSNEALLAAKQKTTIKSTFESEKSTPLSQEEDYDDTDVDFDTKDDYQPRKEFPRWRPEAATTQQVPSVIVTSPRASSSSSTSESASISRTRIFTKTPTKQQHPTSDSSSKAARIKPEKSIGGRYFSARPPTPAMTTSGQVRRAQVTPSVRGGPSRPGRNRIVMEFGSTQAVATPADISNVADALGLASDDFFKKYHKTKEHLTAATTITTTTTTTTTSSSTTTTTPEPEPTKYSEPEDELNTPAEEPFDETANSATGSDEQTVLNNHPEANDLSTTGVSNILETSSATEPVDVAHEVAITTPATIWPDNGANGLEAVGINKQNISFESSNTIIGPVGISQDNQILTSSQAEDYTRHSQVSEELSEGVTHNLAAKIVTIFQIFALIVIIVIICCFIFLSRKNKTSDEDPDESSSSEPSLAQTSKVTINSFKRPPMARLTSPKSISPSIRSTSTTTTSINSNNSSSSGNINSNKSNNLIGNNQLYWIPDSQVRVKGMQYSC